MRVCVCVSCNTFNDSWFWSVGGLCDRARATKTTYSQHLRYFPVCHFIFPTDQRFVSMIKPIRWNEYLWNDFFRTEQIYSIFLFFGKLLTCWSIDQSIYSKFDNRFETFTFQKFQMSKMKLNLIISWENRIHLKFSRKITKSKNPKILIFISR